MEVEGIINAILLGACLLLGYLLLKKIFFTKEEKVVEIKNPEIEPRDFTLKELLEFDGSDPNKPILVALNGNVYDVTVSKAMYGPDGLYKQFAGRDASRALAKMDLSTNSLQDEWDDLSDLEQDEKKILQEWEEKYQLKYKLMGKLLKE